MRRALLAAAALVVLLLIGAGIGYYLHVKHASRDIKGSSTVEFAPTAVPSPRAAKEPGVAWPIYGYDAERLRFLNGSSLAPPFRRIWTFRAQTLVEFPPAVAYGRLFFANNSGVLYAVGAKHGRKAWQYPAHRCVAASPAVDRHVVYESFMNAPPCNPPDDGSDGVLPARRRRHRLRRRLERQGVGPPERDRQAALGDEAARPGERRRCGLG
jgi:hypothetical protein